MHTLTENPREEQHDHAGRSLFSETYVPQTMPGILGTFDLIALYIMAVFWISNVTGVVTGGAAAFTYWLVCALAFFVPCAVVTAQLGVLFPYEGSIYNWTDKALGGFWSFFVGLCAWLAGVLSLVSAADVFVNCLQTLNPSWLVPAWQQGFVIIAVTLFAGVVSLQRARMVQHVINVTAICTGLTVLLIGLAAVIWLLTGHPSATNFGNPSGWSISLDPQTGNVRLLGTVTLALLGATMPLNMGGEIKTEDGKGMRRVITRHLLWGSALVLVGYLVMTFAVLAVEGQNAAFSAPNPIALLVGTVQTVFGRLAGDLTMIGIMLFFVVVAIFENGISARLLMVAGIDGRLPARIARLNRNRTPATAILFQTAIAVLFTAVLFFMIPSITSLANPQNLTTEVYTITAASLLLVWAVSFIFPFVDVVVLAVRFPHAFRFRRLVPQPVLWVCCLLGPLVCATTIVDTLIYSWIPGLIPNSQWWYLVGGLTLICLVICAIGSIFATSEASWEGWRKL
jgi:amino acid transporter